MTKVDNTVFKIAIRVLPKAIGAAGVSGGSSRIATDCQGEEEVDRLEASCLYIGVRSHTVGMRKPVQRIG